MPIVARHFLALVVACGYVSPRNLTARQSFSSSVGSTSVGPCSSPLMSSAAPVSRYSFIIVVRASATSASDLPRASICAFCSAKYATSASWSTSASSCSAACLSASSSSKTLATSSGSSVVAVSWGASSNISTGSGPVSMSASACDIGRGLPMPAGNTKLHA